MDYEPDAELKDWQSLKPDLLVMPWVTLSRVFPNLDDPHWFAVGGRADYVPGEQRYVLSWIEILRPPERGGLNAVDLREIPVMGIVGSAIADQAMLEVGSDVQQYVVPTPEDVAAMSRSERLLAAARRYALSRAIGGTPLKDVAAMMLVSQSTATRLVSDARRAGHLD